MKENYYDILEVSQKASPEVIKKAYLTLVKKYHPDLQDDSKKEEYENKLKKINEAYEVLSDETKKSGNFDSNVNKQGFNWNDSNSNYEDVYNEELLRKQRQLQEELEYQKQVEYAREKAYHDAYIQDLKNRGYKIRYKKSFSDYVRSGISIMITVFVLFLIWQIPFVQNFFFKLYLDNPFLKLIIDPFLNMFKQFYMIAKSPKS